MAIEGPYLAAVVARMANPEVNLAAYGVTFAIGLLMEAPIIMMTAAARLVKGRQSSSTRRFNIVLSTLCTIAMILLIIPGIFDFWTIKLLGLTSEIQAHVHPAMICLLAWPGMIGYRRFYQGILISAKNNKRIAAGTMIRLLSMSLTAIFAYLEGSLAGASVGTLSLSVGVTAEALLLGDVKSQVKHLKQLKMRQTY